VRVGASLYRFFPGFTRTWVLVLYQPWGYTVRTMGEWRVLYFISCGSCPAVYVLGAPSIWNRGGARYGSGPMQTVHIVGGGTHHAIICMGAPWKNRCYGILYTHKKRAAVAPYRVLLCGQGLPTHAEGYMAEAMAFLGGVLILLRKS